MPILRLSSDASFRPGPAGLVARIAWGAAAAIALVAGALLSVAVVAVALAVGTVAGGYLLWKTRALRRALREASQRSAAATGNATPPGRVFEGEAVSVPDEAR